MILVGIGGAAGAACRYLAGIWIGKITGNSFPYPTLFINISGSLLLGILTGLEIIHSIPEWTWLLFGVGFCGAFTTFSTFGYEAIQLFFSRQNKKAFVYITASAILCAVSSFAGIHIII